MRKTQINQAMAERENHTMARRLRRHHAKTGTHARSVIQMLDNVLVALATR